MNTTAIEWTEVTWNPMSGCEKLSEGCKYCYAMTLAERFRGTNAFPNGFDLTIRPHKLDEPRRLKKPSMIFANSMSDLFWDAVPDDYRDKILDVIEDTPQHQYQVLTKRPHEMLRYSRRRRLPDNFWAGTTIESGRLFEERISALIQVDASIRFISAEPLIGPFPATMNLEQIHWMITGGESGRHLISPRIRDRRALVDLDDNGSATHHDPCAPPLRPDRGPRQFDLGPTTRRPAVPFQRLDLSETILDHVLDHSLETAAPTLIHRCPSIPSTPRGPSAAPAPYRARPSTT